MNKLKLIADDLKVESFVSAAAPLMETEGKRELFGSDLNSCHDTECGRNTYCASSPCAC